MWYVKSQGTHLDGICTVNMATLLLFNYVKARIKLIFLIPGVRFEEGGTVDILQLFGRTLFHLVSYFVS
jgi:hypothetical protein